MKTQRIQQVAVATMIAVIGIALLVAWFGGDLFDGGKQSSKIHREMLAGLAFAAGVACACHWWIRRWIVACAVCTMILTVAACVLTVTSRSSAGPFWLIGLFTVALSSFVLAAVVGAFFVAFRRGANIP